MEGMQHLGTVFVGGLKHPAQAHKLKRVQASMYDVPPIYQSLCNIVEYKRAISTFRQYVCFRSLYIALAHLACNDGSGIHWPTRAVRTNLPCPNTGIDVVRLRDGRLLIAFNDSMRTKYAARTKLALAVSSNDGLTWERVL
eukprot:scaffold302389_cov27-Prasinocladus_malaysianus.AAC.1